MKSQNLQKMAVMISLIFVFSVEGLPAFGQGVELVNIHTNPATVQVGESFRFNATVLNNSPDIVYFNGGCISPLSATFDKNVDTGRAMACFAIFNASLKPGENATIIGPSSGVLYTANASGTTNANITFSYQTSDKSVHTVSKLFTFVSQGTTVPEFPFFPLLIFMIATISIILVMASMKNHNLFKL